MRMLYVITVSTTVPFAEPGRAGPSTEPGRAAEVASIPAQFSFAHFKIVTEHSAVVTKVDRTVRGTVVGAAAAVADARKVALASKRTAQGVVAVLNRVRPPGPGHFFFSLCALF